MALRAEDEIYQWCAIGACKALDAGPNKHTEQTPRNAAAHVPAYELHWQLIRNY